MLICNTDQSQEKGRGRNGIKDRKKGLREKHMPEAMVC